MVFITIKPPFGRILCTFSNRQISKSKTFGDIFDRKFTVATTEAVDSHGSPSLMRRDLDTAGKGSLKQNNTIMLWLLKGEDT